MPVSAGLQKYFDSKRKKQGDIGQKFAAIADQIDPAFMQSFELFHDKIMDIVEENPDAEGIAIQELSSLDTKMQNAGRRHNLKKAASIIGSVEQA